MNKYNHAAEKNNWIYMNNHNLTAGMLRDSVHLNRQGEDILCITA